MIPKVVFSSVGEGVKSLLKISILVVLLIFIFGIAIGYLL